jgi:hypothetical protein
VAIHGFEKIHGPMSPTNLSFDQLSVQPSTAIYFTVQIDVLLSFEAKARRCSVQKFFEKLFKLQLFAHSLAVEWPAFGRMSVQNITKYPFKTKKAEA